MNTPSVGDEVLGDLTSRLRATDHEHAAGRKLCSVAVRTGVLLIDVVGKLLSDRWYSRHVLVAGGDDNAGRAVLLVRCLHDVVVTVTAQGLPPQASGSGRHRIWPTPGTRILPLLTCLAEIWIVKLSRPIPRPLNRGGPHLRPCDSIVHQILYALTTRSIG